MGMRRPSVTLLLSLAACSSSRPSADATPPAANTPAAPAWVLTPTSFGKARLGMTVAELNAALGDSLRPTYEISEECDQLVPVSFPANTRLMVLRDSVVRFEADSAGILTPEGVGVGDTEARLGEVYGARAVTTPHKYTGPEGHYVTVTDPSDSTLKTIFETDGTKVTGFRAGRTPGVELVEGCA
jgi:hypothetical protein